MSVSLTNGSATATADELIGAALSLNLRREALDLVNTAAPQINSGTPALLEGQLTYLHVDLTSAAAMAAVYQGLATCTLTTGGGNPLDGFKHVAVGTLRIGLEKVLPGRTPRWTLQVEARQLP